MGVVRMVSVFVADQQVREVHGRPTLDTMKLQHTDVGAHTGTPFQVCLLNGSHVVAHACCALGIMQSLSYEYQIRSAKKV